MVQTTPSPHQCTLYRQLLTTVFFFSLPKQGWESLKSEEVAASGRLISVSQGGKAI